MPGDRYLFVDVGHLRHYRDTMREWFGEEPELQFDYLKRFLGAFKCFYYDCLDDLPRNQESDAERANRIARQQAEFSRIKAVVGSHVRLGTITGAEKARRQKEVDILLAVDMLNHAVRQNMKQAVLLSGDRDFRPVVEALVQMGLYVEVVGDRRHTSTALAEAADAFRPVTISDYFTWSSQRQQQSHRLPLLLSSEPDIDGWQLLREGVSRDGRIELYGREKETLFVAHGRTRTMHCKFIDEARLLFFAQHRFGEITWNAA